MVPPTNSATAAEPLSQQVADLAQQGNQSIEQALTNMGQLRDNMGETTRTVKRLGESAQQLSTLVTALAQIASRTHLFSLNTTLGATRGDMPSTGITGLNDLRTLARQTAKAAEALKQLTTRIQSDTSTVMGAVEEGLQQAIAGTHPLEETQHLLMDMLQMSTQTQEKVSPAPKLNEQRDGAQPAE